MSVASSYAQAFYLSQEKSPNLVASVLSAKNALFELTDMIQQTKELRIAIETPAVSTEEKVKIIEQIAKKAGFSDAVGVFVGLIAKKGRISFAKEIALELEKISAEAEGKVVGEVLAPELVDEAELKDLAVSFEKKLGKPVFLRQKKDPSLLAGLKVTLNGVTYDGTLRSQLSRLKEKFIEYKTRGMN